MDTLFLVAKLAYIIVVWLKFQLVALNCIVVILFQIVILIHHFNMFVSDIVGHNDLQKIEFCEHLTYIVTYALRYSHRIIES